MFGRLPETTHAPKYRATKRAKNMQMLMVVFVRKASVPGVLLTGLVDPRVNVLPTMVSTI